MSSLYGTCSSASFSLPESYQEIARRPIIASSVCVLEIVAMAASKILIYVMRQDLRLSDNPIFDYLSKAQDHGFTHLLPVFVFPAHQMELSGLIADGSKSPYPEARSQLGRYWRCGPYRAKFIAEAVLDVQTSLQNIGSGLLIRAGMIKDAIRDLAEELKRKGQGVSAMWMTGLVGVEEERDEQAVALVCEQIGANFKLWVDEKYFIDE